MLENEELGEMLCAERYSIAALYAVDILALDRGSESRE